MKQETEKWLNAVIKESVLYSERLPDFKVDDSFRWKERLHFLTDGKLNYNMNGLILVGSAGCGKHSAATVFLQDTLRQRPCFWFLYSDELNELKDFSEFKERFDALAAYCCHGGFTLCLVLEDPDAVTYAGQLYRFLWKKLESLCYQDQNVPNMLLLILSEEMPRICSQLREYLILCRLSYPTREQRQTFIQNVGGETLDRSLVNRLAEQTEGRSYSELQDLVLHVQLQYGLYGSVSDEMLDEIVAEQTEPKSFSSEGGISAAFFEQMKTAFAESNYSAGTQNGSLHNQNEIIDSNSLENEAFLSDLRKKSENKSIKQLSVSIFGEEQARQIEMRCKQFN